MVIMMDFYSDLDVVENFVFGLEFWFGRWLILEEYKINDFLMVFECDFF